MPHVMTPSIASSSADDLAKRLFEGAPTSSLQRDETLFRQGDRAANVYLVVSGGLRLVRTAPNGQTAILQAAGSGEIVAEGALFSQAYQCDCVADRVSVVAALSTAALRNRLEQDGPLCLALLRRTAHQLHQARALIELRNIRSAEERVLAHLYHVRPPDHGEVRFDRPLIAIAAELGLSHEAYYRALAGLQGSGRIRRRGRSIGILDSSALQ